LVQDLSRPTTPRNRVRVSIPLFLPSVLLTPFCDQLISQAAVGWEVTCYQRLRSTAASQASRDDHLLTLSSYCDEIPGFAASLLAKTRGQGDLVALAEHIAARRMRGRGRGRRRGGDQNVADELVPDAYLLRDGGAAQALGRVIADEGGL